MKDRVLAFLRRPRSEDFEDLALALFAWQVEHNPDYRALAGDLHPQEWTRIPTVPVGLFRDLDLTCFPASQARYQFHTSGTTTGRPGVHRLRDAEVYDASASRWFLECVPHAPPRAISLVPSPARAPNSSLSHMVGLLYPDATWAVDAQGQPDTGVAWDALARTRTPVFLATTALALDLLLSDRMRLELPPGSLLMVTGGFKGRTARTEPRELLSTASDRLGAPVVGEYGMTELRSQMWTQVAWGAQADPEGPFYPPPWMRALVVDPDTGLVLPPGVPGQIRFVDLANHDTVLAVETLDHGTLHPDGSVRLHGRLPGAPARGCSLTVEEALLARP